MLLSTLKFQKQSRSLRERLIVYLTLHAPEKVATVDILLEKLSEQQISAKLAGKYNVPFQEAQPVSPLSSKHLSSAAAMATGATPPSTRKTLRERLLSYFTAHAPGKISTLDILVEKVAAASGWDEQRLAAALESRYGEAFRVPAGLPAAQRATAKPAAAIGAFFDLSKDGKRESLTEARTRELFEGITPTNAPGITKIQLSNKSFDAPSARVAAEKLTLMKNLKFADLSDIIAGRETSIGLEVLNIFSKALVETPLVWVDLSDNALGPRGVNVCEPLLSSSETLEGIAFKNDGLSAEACEEITRLFLKLGSPTRLKKLHFWNNMSGDGGAVAIAKLLKQSPYIEDFMMATTRCGEGGGVVLCKALKHCTMLHTVDMNDNTFNVSGA